MDRPKGDSLAQDFLKIEILQLSYCAKFSCVFIHDRWLLKIGLTTACFLFYEIHLSIEIRQSFSPVTYITNVL